MPFQTMFPRERLHHVRVSFSQPIRRWPCLIRRSRAEAAVLAAALVVAAEAEVLVEGDSVRLIRRRETMDDLLRPEISSR